MNIFFLDENPSLAAQYHADKHVVKMILETAQLLSTAHAILDNNGQQVEGLYKPTHKNHPCAVWVRENIANYVWTALLFENLLKEYEYRYEKTHKSSKLLGNLLYQPKNIYDTTNNCVQVADINKHMTSPALAMPEQYKQSDPVQAYRDYYMGEKRHIAKWSDRGIPVWWR